MDKARIGALRLGTRQRGLGTWGTMLLVLLLIMLALVGMKLMPMYIDSFSIKESLNSLGEQDLTQYNKGQIKQALVKRFDISAVKAITARNFGEKVTISKNGKRTHVVVDYRDEQALFGNISLVANFKFELRQ